MSPPVGAPAGGPVGRFPTVQRIRKRSEFQEIQSRGRRVTTEHFVLVLYARREAAAARLGVTASRRLGSAVARNRAKRLIREAFRTTRELWARDIDLVVIVRRDPGGLKLREVVQEWRSASRRIDRQTGKARWDRACSPRGPKLGGSGHSPLAQPR